MIIEQVRIIDPSRKIDDVRDLYIDGDQFSAGPVAGDTVRIDGRGLVAFPGLIDMHVHLRDPGLTYKEDILTGTAAAAAGGFTTVACMPNTKPVLDVPAQLEYVTEKARTASARVFPVAAVTIGQEGKALTDFTTLKAAGAVAFSDDGVPVDSAAMLREAMRQAHALAIPIISHCEDREMVQNFGVNEGAVSHKLGLPGRPAVAEAIQVARDILLAQDTGAHVHIAHVSTAQSVELIRRAKADGVSITAETCPQYFTLTEDTLLTRGPLARVNPPLRTAADQTAIIAGLQDGTIDAIVTDHAPHSAAEKTGSITDTMSGMIGLETALGLTLTALYHTGKLGLMEVARLMSTAQAEILGLPYGTLEPSSPADVTIFAPDESWTVEPDSFYSKARNTPFGGMTLQGRVRYTICGGKLQYQYIP
ncbi:MAG: dihydroorotase [Oscillospiraceae bacterium]|nr:dihydroorotase [Oscillospiraceae bacterium]